MTKGISVSQMTNGMSVSQMTKGMYVSQMTKGMSVSQMTKGMSVSQMTTDMFRLLHSLSNPSFFFHQNLHKNTGVSSVAGTCYHIGASEFLPSF
jgi:hypothetical protein